MIYYCYCSFLLVFKKKLNAMVNEKYRKNKHKKLSMLFFDGMENIEDFDPKLLKIDKKFYKSINIYYINISQ